MRILRKGETESTDVIPSVYDSPEVFIGTVLPNRTINGKVAKRQKVTEVVIRSYPLKTATPLPLLLRQRRCAFSKTCADSSIRL